MTAKRLTAKRLTAKRLSPKRLSPKRLTAKRRIGVLISGRGSNMIALAKACAAASYPAEISVVVSNVADAAGVARAQSLGVQTATIPHRAFDGKAEFEAALDAALRAAEAEVICLAGFMRVLSADFISGWEGRILNIHPSLLPSFPGLDATAQAVAAGVRIHGATVHLVTPDLDAGPILAQAAIRVDEGETADSVSARLIKVEHKLYPSALRHFLEATPPARKTETAAKKPRRAAEPTERARPAPPVYSPPLATG